MKPKHRYLLVLLLLSVVSLPASATNVLAKIVDGLGRPVDHVAVDIYWLKTVTENDVRQIDVLKTVSDDHGVVKATYDEKAIPADEFIFVEIAKEGYAGYSTTDFKPEYVLEREIGPADVRRIAALDGNAQVEELRELLAADFRGSDEPGEGLEDLVFVQEHRFRPALRSLITDAKVGKAAGQLLAFIGDPEDVRLILDHAPPPSEDFFENRWAYGVVSALLEPMTAKEWSFLRSCALNEYDDRWVDAGAINTLKLIASPKSLQILRDAAKANAQRAASIAKAIQYIESGPAPLADEDLADAGKKVAQAMTIGDWKGNKEPRLNEKGDKALVDCQYIDGRDWLVYTATFHKVNGQWKLRGLCETMQALLAEEPEPDDQPVE